MQRSRLLTLLAALAALVLMLTACAEDAEDVAEEPEDDDAPLELDDDDDDLPDLDDEDEDVDEEEEVAEEEEDLDVHAAVDQYASTLPDGWAMFREADELNDILEIDGSVVIDVRNPEDFEEAHIPGSINIPIRDLGDNLNYIPTDAPVAVTCQTGWRTGMAVSALRMMGYDNVEGWANEFPAWEEAGYETESGAVEAEDVGEPDLPEPELVEEISQWLATLPDGWMLVREPADVADAIDAGAEVVDLRGPEDFEEAQVEGAMNIPIRELADRIDEVPTDVDVVFHCQSGWRCALAMPILGMLGYDNMLGYPGHFDGLVDEGLTT